MSTNASSDVIDDIVINLDASNMPSISQSCDDVTSDDAAKASVETTPRVSSASCGDLRQPSGEDDAATARELSDTNATAGSNESDATRQRSNTTSASQPSSPAHHAPAGNVPAAAAEAAAASPHFPLMMLPPWMIPPQNMYPRLPPDQARNFPPWFGMYPQSFNNNDEEETVENITLPSGLANVTVKVNKSTCTLRVYIDPGVSRALHVYSLRSEI